jgi:hypothetical protein
MDHDGDGDYETLITINDMDTDGFRYINIHLDYGLKKTEGWQATDLSNDGLTPDATNPSRIGPDGVLGEDIAQMTEYDFAADADGILIPDSGDEIYNNNILKKSWGAGGLVLDTSPEAANAPNAGLSYQLVAGVDVGLMRNGNLLGQDETDEDGWWSIDYKHKGKSADYQLVYDTDGDGFDEHDLSTTITLGKSTKYEQVDFDVHTEAPALALKVEEGANTGEQAGEDLTQGMIAAARVQALSFWAMEGVDAQSLETLLRTDVRIDDLGGDQLGQTLGSSVTLDDDAAGYGWSVTAEEDEVDLVSVLTHEFGHVLGYDHSYLGESLAVGERDMPGDEGAAATLPELAGDADLWFS